MMASWKLYHGVSRLASVTIKLYLMLSQIVRNDFYVFYRRALVDLQVNSKYIFMEDFIGTVRMKYVMH